MFQVCHTLCAIISVWNAILAKSWDLFAGWAVEIFLRRVEFLLWAVEGFIMKDRKFLDERSRFSWWTVEIFWMNGRGFLDKRWRFSWWTVQSFMMKGQIFLDERLKFSWWTAEIFLMNGLDFHDERSKLSRWQVEIWHVQNCLLLWLKSRSAGQHLAIQLLWATARLLVTRVSLI